ncbi:hypothetical protein KY285_013811 [Solanum tuberosum]|nr:hypothetical protein KY285_013811 [Solanum tuberosum]
MEDTQPNKQANEGDLFDDAADEFPFDDCSDIFSDAEIGGSEDDVNLNQSAENENFPSSSLRHRRPFSSNDSGNESTNFRTSISSEIYSNSRERKIRFSRKLMEEDKDKNGSLDNIESSNSMQLDLSTKSQKGIGDEQNKEIPTGMDANSVIIDNSNEDSSLLKEDSVITDVNNDRINNSEEVNSHLREIDDSSSNILFDLANVVIKSVGFQVNMLITIEQSSVWRLGLQFGWGCLWSVYVCFVLVGLLVSAFIMGGILIRIMVEEPIRMNEPLNFDYTAKSPVAYVPIIRSPGVTCGVDSQVDVGMVDGVRVIPPNHKLQVTVSLMLPESDYNRNLGIFQVRVDFLTSNGKVLSSARRPCMLQFKSNPIRLFSTFLKAAPLVTGYTSESQKLKVDLKGFSEGFIPTACLRVIIEQRAEFHPGGGVPEIYAASLTLESELPFMKRMLWYWKTTLFVWVSMTLFTMEFLFALLCCKPLIIPRLRLRHDPNSRTGSPNNAPIGR